MGRFATAAEFEQWVRTEMTAGRPIDALGTRTIVDEVERFASRIISGAEHDYWRGSWYFKRNDGRMQHARRWLLERHMDRKLVVPHDVVVTSCRESRCIRLAHLRLQSRRGGPMTEGEAIARIRASARRLGHLPTRREWSSVGMPSPQALERIFGSVDSAIEAAGFEPRPSIGGGLRYSDDDVREAVRIRARELGRVPGKREWLRSGWSPSHQTIARRFGSLRGALDS